MFLSRPFIAAVCACLAGGTVVTAAGAAAQAPQSTWPAAAAQAPQSAVPTGYVIGADDTLGILFWREEGLSGDVVVRPDGNISVPLLNDVMAAGLTPEALRVVLQERSRKFIEDPNVTVVVRQINSRKVFITGQVTRPGTHPLASRTTVLQLIALAGGLTEFTDGKEIVIIRPGVPQPMPFNYDAVRKGKKLEQNIELMAGDTVVVP